MAADDMAVVENEPVIASSNRYADVEPYCKTLLATDPLLWGQVLPWEFPQNATQEAEEEFLKQFFTEREIRMQGGSPNGYRFLKQVWYSCALWNINHRLPLTVAWWFEQPNSKALLEDPDMKKYLLHPEAEPSTFFERKNLDMWGEKFLGIVVKQIQFQIDPSCNNEAPEQPTAVQSEEKPAAKLETPASVPAEVVSAPVVPEAKPDEVIEEHQLAENGIGKANPHSSKLAAQSPAFQPVQVGEAPGSAPAQFAHAHKPFKQDTQEQRSVSGEAYTGPANRDAQFRKRRGSGGFNKRNSFSSSRHFQRPPSGYESHYQPTSSPHVPPGGIYPSVGMMSAPQGRIASGGAYDRPQGPMPVLPQGQPFVPQAAMHGQPVQHQFHPHFAPQMPGEQPTFMGHMPPPPGFHTGPHPQPQMFERNNVGNEQYFSNDARMNNFDNTPDRHSKHRESFGSRGGHGRGKGSIGRGRGSKGKNSYGQPFVNNGGLMDPNAFKRNTPGIGQIGPFPGQDPTAGFRPQNDLAVMQWRMPGQDENAMPRGPMRNDFVSYSPNMMAQGAGMNDSQSHLSGTRTFTKQPYYEPVCSHNCSATHIDRNCTEARKLIVFSVSPSANSDQLAEYFQKFGKVLDVNTSVVRPGYDRTMAFVTFDQVEGARNCLSSAGSPWSFPAPTNNLGLQVQVSRNHFDPKHRSQAGRDQMRPPTHEAVRSLPQDKNAAKASGSPLHTDSEPVPSSAKPEEHASDAALKSSESSHSLAVQQQESIAEDSTPTASARSSPKKKQQQGRKNAKAKKKAAADEKAMDLAMQRQDSIIAASVQQEETVKSELPLDAPNETAQVKNPEAPEETPQSKLAEAESKAPLAEEPSQVDEEVPKATNEEAVTGNEVGSTEVSTNSEISEAGDENKSPTSVKDAATQKSLSKPEEDQNDESFHTASDSPERIRPADVTEEDAATPTAPKTPSTPITELKDSLGDRAEQSLGGTQSPDENKEKANAEMEESPSAGGEAQKPQSQSPTVPRSAKKAPIPQFPKGRNVSIALPKAEVKTTPATPEVEGDGSLKVPQQRSGSSGSEAPPSAFVTAPNTPAIPGSGPEASSAPEVEPQTPQEKAPKAEPQSQQDKTPKAKGPEQTESLSIFGKKAKKPKAPKPKKGSMRGKPKLEGITSGPGSGVTSRAVSGVSTPIPEDTMATQTTGNEDEQSQAPAENQNIDVEDETAAVPATVLDSQETTSVPEEADSSKAKDDSRPRGNTFTKFFSGLLRRESTQGSKSVDGEAQIKEEAEDAPESAVVDGDYEPVAPEAMASTVTQESTETTEGPIENTPESQALAGVTQQDSSEVDVKEEVEGEEEVGEQVDVGLGISTDATAPVEAESKSGNKKKKNKKKKPAKKATADVVEQSVPVLDAHTDGPLSTYEGNSEGEAAVMASGQQLQPTKSSRKIGSGDDHLVHAATPRRKPSRRLGADSSKGSNSTDSDQDVSVFKFPDNGLPQVVHIRPQHVTSLTLEEIFEGIHLPKSEEEKAKALKITDTAVDEDRGVSPEVEAARARDREMKEQEKARKDAKKEKAQ